MNTISAIHNLYAYDDGDTLTPTLAVSIDSGFGLTQYWNPIKDMVINTDFTKHPAKLYPDVYSSKRGKIVDIKKTTDSTAGYGTWMYGTTTLTFASTTSTKTIGSTTYTYYACTNSTELGAIFGLLSTAETINGIARPILIIFGNIASASVQSDVAVFFNGLTVDNKNFSCSKTIPIQSTVGESLKTLITAENGDTVISDGTDSVKLTAFLQNAGTTITDASVTYTWWMWQNGSWVQITSSTNGFTIGNSGTGYVANTLTVAEGAVNSVASIKCRARYNSVNYDEHIVVSDIHDPYYIDDGCSVAGENVPYGTDVTFTPKIYSRVDGGTEVDYAANPWRINFNLVRANDKTTSVMGSGPVTLNPASGERYTVTYATISSNGGVIAQMEATLS